MTPVSKDIADLLVARLRLVLGTSLFIGSMPDLDDTGESIVCVQEYGSEHQQPRININQENVSIKARGADYLTSFDRLYSVRKVLEGIDQVVINSNTIQGIILLTPLFHIMNDTKHRSLWGCNFRVWRTPNSDDRRQY